MLKEIGFILIPNKAYPNKSKYVFDDNPSNSAYHANNIRSCIVCIPQYIRKLAIKVIETVNNTTTSVNYATNTNNVTNILAQSDRYVHALFDRIFTLYSTVTNDINTSCL